MAIHCGFIGFSGFQVKDGDRQIRIGRGSTFAFSIISTIYDQFPFLSAIPGYVLPFV
jgi:hypothetical protein